MGRGFRHVLELLLFAAGCGGRVGSHSPETSGSVMSGSATAGGEIGGVSGASSASSVSGASGASSISGASSPSSGTEEASCVILESSYNQTCELDNDCVGVNPGNFCAAIRPCFCGPTGVVNLSSVAQFNADIANTPAFSDAAAPGNCACPPGPATPGPCCQLGMCQFGPICSPYGGDTDAAGNDGTCPATQPMSGAPCTGPASCTYKGPCGPLTMTCQTSSSYWAVSMSTPCAGGCPAAEPKVGDPCMAQGKCSYVSGCGGSDTIFCSGTGTVSMVMAGTCPACPSAEPPPLGACSVAMSCPYTNGCNGTDTATCAASTWTVQRGPCGAVDAGPDSDVDGM